MTPEMKQKLIMALKAEKQRRADAKEYDPTKGMSGFEKAVAGYGKSASNIAGHLIQAALPKKFEPERVAGIPVSSAARKEDEELSNPLMDTWQGQAGSLASDIITTLPVSMGAGAALGAGAKATQGATGLLRLAKAGAYRPVQAGVQGVLEGALTAPEGKSGANAAAGGAIGAGLSALPVGIGRLARKLSGSSVNVTPEAEALRRVIRRATGDKKALIPIAQAADPDSLTGDVYRGFVSNLPGGGRVRKQFEHALDQFRETALFRAVPYGVRSDDIFRASGPFGPEDIQGGVARLQAAWDDAFRPVNDATFTTPRQFSMFKRANQMLENQFGVRIPAGNVQVKGSTLTDLRTKLKELEWNTQNVKDKNILKIASQRLDETIKSQLPADQAMIYARNQKRWKYYRDLMGAIAKEPKAAKFTPSALARSASTRAGEKGLGGGGGRMQRLGNLGDSALKGFPSKRGIFQMMAAYGGVNVLGGAAGLSTINEDDSTMEKIGKVAAGASAPYFLAKGLSSPAVQRGLTEGFAGPKVASKLMDEYAKALRAAGLTSRQIAVALANEE